MIRAGETVVDGVHLAWAPLAAVDGVRASAVADLGAEERERLEELNDARADRLLLGRHLVRTLARRVGALAPDAPVRIDAGCPRCGREHGRPTFPDLPLVAGLSHLGPVTIAAVAPLAVVCRLGVDGEFPPGPDGADLVAWTKAEAIAKATGDGVAHLAGPGEAAAMVARAEAEGWRLVRVPVPGAVVHLALPPAPGAQAPAPGA
ncbi:hypothetical protein [Serinibacter salmoneus]|uniref:4'-phosphopantetheinyl transferase n=1 Tax=Serinibacter salmoneus TaxID=556530 RepID=A0A2A9CYP0_9MICO|nr:hypothetical protein [Serinibacter salmoneus]PFG18730.1 4'-phosphopantetheinyl transferase [Serinibacter salmoneus]